MSSLCQKAFEKYREEFPSLSSGFSAEWSFQEGFFAARNLIQDLVSRQFGSAMSIKLYNLLDEAKRAANRTEIKMDDLIGGVVVFNADADAIEDEELAGSVMDMINEYGFEAITDREEIETAKSQLDLEPDDVRTIYRCGNACKFVLP